MDFLIVASISIHLQGMEFQQVAQLLSNGQLRSAKPKYDLLSQLAGLLEQRMT